MPFVLRTCVQEVGMELVGTYTLAVKGSVTCVTNSSEFMGKAR